MRGEYYRPFTPADGVLISLADFELFDVGDWRTWATFGALELTRGARYNAFAPIVIHDSDDPAKRVSAEIQKLSTLAQANAHTGVAGAISQWVPENGDASLSALIQIAAWLGVDGSGPAVLTALSRYVGGRRRDGLADALAFIASRAMTPKEAHGIAMRVLEKGLMTPLAAARFVAAACVDETMNPLSAFAQICPDLPREPSDSAAARLFADELLRRVGSARLLKSAFSSRGGHALFLRTILQLHRLDLRLVDGPGDGPWVEITDRGTGSRQTIDWRPDDESMLDDSPWTLTSFQFESEPLTDPTSADAWEAADAL